MVQRIPNMAGSISFSLLKTITLKLMLPCQSLSKMPVWFFLSGKLNSESCWLSPDTFSYWINGKLRETPYYFPRRHLLVSTNHRRLGVILNFCNFRSGRCEDVNEAAQTAKKIGIILIRCPLWSMSSSSLRTSPCLASQFWFWHIYISVLISYNKMVEEQGLSCWKSCLWLTRHI